MNYKKMGIIGMLCAMAALTSQKAKGDTYVIGAEPVYTTTYTTPSVVYGTSPIYTQPVVYTTPVAYDNAYYDGYYDAMNRRWWYNNSWCYRRPPVCRPRYYGRCYRPVRHCAPVRPHFDRCAPRGGFHGGYHRGFHGGHHGFRGCR